MKAAIYNNHFWITETDPDKIKDHYKALLLKAGFTMLHEVEHHFSPFGYTYLVLIAESHFAAHTFPEENKTYIELSSCNKEKSEAFMQSDSWTIAA